MKTPVFIGFKSKYSDSKLPNRYHNNFGIFLFEKLYIWFILVLMFP